MSVAASELCIGHTHLRLANCRSRGGDDIDDERHPPGATQGESNRALQISREGLEEARRHYFRYRRRNNTSRRCTSPRGRALSNLSSSRANVASWRCNVRPRGGERRTPLQEVSGTCWYGCLAFCADSAAVRETVHENETKSKFIFCQQSLLFHKPNNRYLRWADAVSDPCGISHAHACLAQVHQAMGDEGRSEHHRHASLEQCRRRGDIDNQGKVSGNLKPIWC